MGGCVGRAKVAPSPAAAVVTKYRLKWEEEAEKVTSANPPAVAAAVAAMTTRRGDDGAVVAVDMGHVTWRDGEFRRRGEDDAREPDADMSPSPDLRVIGAPALAGAYISPSVGSRSLPYPPHPSRVPGSSSLALVA